MGAAAMRSPAFSVCVLVAVGSLLVEALPLVSDEVVPEDDALLAWHEDGESLHGQPGLSKLIAQKEQQEKQAKDKAWKDEGFLTNSVLTTLRATSKRMQDAQTEGSS